MKHSIFSFLVRWFLKEFSVSERQLSEGEYAAAMQAVAGSPALKSYLNITLANLIRRHLYIKDMHEGNWYLGQIAALRKIQVDAEKWQQMNGNEIS